MEGYENELIEKESDCLQEASETENVNETPEEKFIRIGQRRVNNVLKQLESLGQLSNRRAYSYTEEQTEKMFAVIEKELQEVKEKFQEPKEKQPFSF